MANRKKMLVLLVLIGGVGLVSYLVVHKRLLRADTTIKVSGNIEVTEAQVSFKIPGRVQERLVDEGEMVVAGQLVARLDSIDLAQEVAMRQAETAAAAAALAELEAGSRPEEIAQAEAAADRAQARLDELTAGFRSQEIRAAEAAVEQARAEAKRLQSDYQRQNQLYQREVISTREFEASRSASEAAAARWREAGERLNLLQEGTRREQLDQAQATLKEARERFNLVKSGPRQETIDQSQARLQQVREALGLAQTRLGYASLASPLSGVVVSKNIEPGEFVAAGTPIITVADLQHVWLRAYINETDLGRVKIGQTVNATNDSYPGKRYGGRVSFLGSQAEFTPKNVQTEKERVKLVYRIKVTIDNPQLELKPGMPADAVILVNGAGK